MPDLAKTDRADAAGRLVLGLGALALAAVAVRLAWLLPPASWWQAAVDPAPRSIAELVFHDAALPRAAVALLCGMALGLAGALFQQVLRNPLASPTTLGVEAGAQLALAAALVFAPGLLGWPFGRELAALAGAGVATAIVFAVAWARGFSSLSLVIAGLVVGLFCGACGAVLKLLNQEYVAVLFIWGAGSLVQQDWSVVAALLPRLALLGLAAAILVRPLALLALDDTSARGLGVALAALRAAALAVAVLLTVAVTAAVGVVGFVGLAAPQIVRLAGARRFGRRVLLAPLVGGFLLLLVDQVAAALSTDAVPVPAGAATALLGAPLLLWLLPRLRHAGGPPDLGSSASLPHRARPGLTITGLALLLALSCLAAALIGRNPSGLHLADAASWPLVAPWRLPRIAVAAAAGAMLATAGGLLQRLTGNPMASPEVLGVGTGVGLGLVASLLVAAAPTREFQAASGSLGALVVLIVLVSSGIRARFAPDHLLLTGIALAALLDAIVVAFLALGDPRAGQVLAWISGSTYGVEGTTAIETLVVGAVLLAAIGPLRRWLDILLFGAATASALGVPLTAARGLVMLLAALLTASAMLVVGPLTFVGLMGPHLARALGLHRAGAQLAGAALVGASVMVVADWIGRVVIAPQELPAGLVAALIGAPALIWHLARRSGR